MGAQLGLFSAGARTPAKPARKVRGGRARAPAPPERTPEQVREEVLALACAEGIRDRDIARLAKVDVEQVRELLEEAARRKEAIRRAIAVHIALERVPAGPLRTLIRVRPPR